MFGINCLRSFGGGVVGVKQKSCCYKLVDEAALIMALISKQVICRRRQNHGNRIMAPLWRYGFVHLILVLVAVTTTIQRGICTAQLQLLVQVLADFFRTVINIVGKKSANTCATAGIRKHRCCWARCIDKKERKQKKSLSVKLKAFRHNCSAA